MNFVDDDEELRLIPRNVIFSKFSRNSSASGFPDPLPGLHPWTSLGDFRSPAPLNQPSLHWSLFYSTNTTLSDAILLALPWVDIQS